jgi:hypothetical protein
VRAEAFNRPNQMNFDLHPDAGAAFIAQAQAVADRIRVKDPAPQPANTGFKVDAFIGHALTADDLRGPVEVSANDAMGKRVDRFTTEGSKLIGLGEADYPQLVKLARSIQKTPAFRNVVSVEFVEGALFRWCLKACKQEATQSACDFIIGEANTSVRELEIWIPIYSLYVQTPFSVGPVLYKPITREMLDVWQQRIRSESGDSPKVLEALERRRKELQALAAGVVSILAEPQRAFEVASERVDAATALLRLFAPANFEPNLLSYCVPLGSHLREGHHYLTVRDEKIVGETRGVLPRGTNPWVIDDPTLRQYQSLGLTAISDLFSKEPKTDLENSVFEALLLYSKASLVPEAAEKLLYIFAALESVLLLNETEPITQNVGERLAFLVANDADSRLKVKKLVTEAYAVRSSFVHHGKRIEEFDQKEILMNSWNGLHAMVGNTKLFKTKEELLATIERHKFR